MRRLTIEEKLEIKLEKYKKDFGIHKNIDKEPLAKYHRIKTMKKFLNSRKRNRKKQEF